MKHEVEIIRVVAARSAILVGLFLLALPTWAADDGMRELQRVAAGDVRMIAEGIHSYATANNMYPSPFGQLTDAGALERELVPDYVSVLPPRDPWGRPYWYWTNGEHFIVGSGGPKGVEQQWRTELSSGPRGPARALQELCSSPGQAAVLLVDGNFCRLAKEITDAPVVGELTEQDRQALTVRDVRAIAIAVLAYSLDNNTYPVLTDGTADAQALKPLLEPNYIRGLPLSDAWGHAFSYWSNGKNFIVYSIGGDHEDQSYGALLWETDDAPAQLASICSGASRRLGSDIVFANGEPCKWPAGSLEDQWDAEPPATTR